MRMVSILGDSISTFEGYNPEGYSVYYDKQMQEINNLNSVYDTWWAKVNQALHAYLCVNNSFSGSKVSGKSFPAGESRERLRNLRTDDYEPNLILIYLGFNDFGNGVEVFPAKSLLNNFGKPPCFETAYNAMIKMIRAYYPDSEIVCGTLMRTKIKDRDDWVFPENFAGIEFDKYNHAIRKAAQKNYCYLADVAAIGERYETLDGSHPTSQGHLTIANSWIRCLNTLGLLM